MNIINLAIATTRLTAVLAANDWATGFGSIVSLLNMIGLVLCFGGLIFAATMFMMGQTERVLYGVVGAAIGGLAWVITKTMFEDGGGGEITIDLQ
ncbi:MAG: hypothetical protein KDM91_11030 [Verrucomicrobiae bacterium]|nr:hypothetical protein [Verrucomicrobiae bacterium]MCP5541210.1 hypothetical protein [Akkermansiaceae bacterium]MCP5551646.1 hypothetical protein [Akkermansiaceae bacterium]